MKHPCPVCNFPGLTEPPRGKSGGGSYEICPSCGFQFGVSDDDRGITYSQWREKWIQGGAKWSSQQTPPPNWNGETQLAGLGRKPSGKKRCAI
jgi:hypothetical protein